MWDGDAREGGAEDIYRFRKRFTFCGLKLQVEFDIDFDIFGCNREPGFSRDEILDSKMPCKLYLTLSVTVGAIEDLARVGGAIAE